MKAHIYVDGFNLYYRALKGTPYRWISLSALAERLLGAGDTVELVRYFTARVSARSGDPDAPRRQQLLFNALKTDPKIVFHYGRFLAKTKWRPRVSDGRSVEIHDTEEKGSDVNLAAHLMNDAWAESFDVALVLSQDTDLIEPIRILTQERGKTVGIVQLDGRQPNNKMAAAASFVRHLSNADLQAAQFPNPIVLPGGREIHKPPQW